LDYTPGHFPAASVKIVKKYNCVSESEPTRRRAEAVDTIAADNLLEQMNSGSGIPDSVKGRR
jgi:penicillin-binding protein 1A